MGARDGETKGDWGRRIDERCPSYDKVGPWVRDAAPTQLVEVTQHDGHDDCCS